MYFNKKIAEENICNACTADKIKFDYVVFLELESRMSCKQLTIFFQILQNTYFHIVYL